MYNIVNLESLCKGIIDCPHSTPKWKNEGIPVIRNYNLKNGKIDCKNLSFVSEEDYKERVRRAIPEESDIIISREAPMGVVGIVPKGFQCCLGQRLVLLKIDKSKCLPKYLLYTLMSEYVQLQIRRINQTGSIVSNLNISSLKELKILLHNFEEQRKIANILSAIDDKIQINNQINQELEAMAKTLYDYWFVQFDFPDQNGKPYKSSGGKMVYNPELKREIPEGWGVEKLGDVAYLKAGGDKPSNISEIQSKETPFPIYSNGLDNKGLYGYTNKATIHKKSLTVSARGTIGYVQRRFSSFFPIIRLISVTPKEEKMIGYIENFLKSIQFENSGSVQRQLTVPQIDKLYILVPKNEVLKKYHSMTINYYFEVENNEQQNQELIQLRDWILPMLMNGQVKVE